MCEEDKHDWVPYDSIILRDVYSFGFDNDSKINGTRTQSVICVECGKVKEVEPEN